MSVAAPQVASCLIFGSWVELHKPSIDGCDLRLLKRNEKYWLNTRNLRRQMKPDSSGVNEVHDHIRVEDKRAINVNKLKVKRIYPWDIEVRHQLFKGPRLLCLLLVVQRYLFAELPGVRATCARGAGHGAGRSSTTSATCFGGEWKTVLAGSYFAKSLSKRCSKPMRILKAHLALSVKPKPLQRQLGWLHCLNVFTRQQAS